MNIEMKKAAVICFLVTAMFLFSFVFYHNIFLPLLVLVKPPEVSEHGYVSNVAHTMISCYCAIFAAVGVGFLLWNSRLRKRLTR